MSSELWANLLTFVEKNRMGTLVVTPDNAEDFVTQKI